MSGMSYVGRAPATGTDVVTRIAEANVVAAASPGQVSAQTEINSLVALKAARAYVDTQASNYASPSYYQTRDLLNIPQAAVGAVNEVQDVVTVLPSSSYYGAASLDSTGKIPLPQVSPVGAGYALGPFGPTAGFDGSTTSTPFKVADWNIGVQSLTFVAMVTCTVMMASTMGKPVLEVRISNGQAVYGSQTLVARGVGRTCYSTPQAVSAWAYPGASGAHGPSGLTLPPNTNIWLSAWIYDALGQTVSAAPESVVNGAVTLIRTTQ